MSARLRRWYEERELEPPWFALRDSTEPASDEILQGGSDREILRRLIEDDPFELGKLAALVASDEARLVYLHRFTARIAAQVAFRSASGRPVGSSLIQWLRSQATQCLEDLLEEDAEDERAQVPMTPDLAAEYASLIPKETGIEPELARKATIIFNRFPLLDRVPFYRLAVEAFPLESLARDLGDSEQKISRRIERVTRALAMQIASYRERRGNR